MHKTIKHKALLVVTNLNLLEKYSVWYGLWKDVILGSDDLCLWDGRLMKMEVDLWESYGTLNSSTEDQQTMSR